MICPHCKKIFEQTEAREIFCSECNEEISRQLRAKRLKHKLPPDGYSRFVAKKFVGFDWVEGERLYYNNGNDAFYLSFWIIKNPPRRGRLFGEAWVDPDHVYEFCIGDPPSEENHYNTRAAFKEFLEDKTYRVKEW